MFNEYVTRLHEERNRALTEEQTIVREALAAGRSDLTGEERTKIGKLDETIDRLDKEIAEWLNREQRDRENDEARAAYEPYVRPQKLEQSFGGAGNVEEDPVARFLRGELRSVDIDISGAAREREAARLGATGKEFLAIVNGKPETRDLTTTGDASLIPTNYARTLYDFLETYSGVRRTGATIMTTTDGNTLTLPVVATHTTAVAATEGTALTETEPTFTTVSLTAYKYGQLTQISHELPRDAMVDVMNFVARDAGRALGKATGVQYVLGDGTTEPEGVTVGFSSGKTTDTGTGGIPTYSNLVDLMYSLGDEGYRMGAVWLTKDSNVAELRKLLDLDNRPLWEPSLKVGEPDVLLGHRVVTDTNMPAFALNALGLAFGDFASGFIIRDVGTIRFERSDDFAFDADLVTFRSIIFTDSAVRDSGAVKLMTGAAT